MTLIEVVMHTMDQAPQLRSVDWINADFFDLLNISLLYMILKRRSIFR